MKSMQHSIVLLVIALFMALPSIGQMPAKSQIDLTIKKLEADAALQHGRISVFAENMDNGKIIVDHHADQVMTPASIQKLLTTAVALEVLGSGFQFETHVAAAIDPGTGAIGKEIFVFASGDPTLQSRYYQSDPSSIDRLHKMLNQFASFDGQLHIDASIHTRFNTSRGWIWEDMGNYFGTSPSALMWRDNLLEVYFNTGQAGTPALISKKSSNLQAFDFHSEVVAAQSNRDNAWFFGAPHSDLIYAKGSIPANRTNFLVKAAHPKPMFAFGNELIEKMGWDKAEVHIEYNYIEHTGLTTIGTLVSPPLSSIVRLCNSKSLNNYAEAICTTLDPNSRGKSIEGGVQAIEDYLKKKQIDTKGMRLLDGSGLSPLNRISGHQMLGVLKMMYRSENKDEFINSLSVAGQSGTLASSFQHSNLKGNLKAKSGTMSGVRNYAGYFTNSSGETIAFCFMIENYDESKRSVVMNRLEELLVAMYNY